MAIPLGVVWGILIWNEWPDKMALVGIVLILAGGLYTIYRENIKSVDLVTSSPMPATAAIAQLPDFKRDADAVRSRKSQKLKSDQKPTISG